MFIMPRGPAPKPSGGHGCGLMMRSVAGRIGSLWSSMAPRDRWWLGMDGVKSFVVCSLVCDGSLQLFALVGAAPLRWINIAVHWYWIHTVVGVQMGE